MGVFDSDGAHDFLGDVAELSGDDRYRHVEQLLLTAVKPGAMWNEVFPDQVLTAAVLVAISLPSTRDLLNDIDLESASPAVLPAPAPQLAGRAVAAIDAFIGIDDEWQQGWYEESDRAQAFSEVERVLSVLHRAAV